MYNENQNPKCEERENILKYVFYIVFIYNTYIPIPTYIYKAFIKSTLKL